MLVATRSPQTLQAFTFSPSPFHAAALAKIGLVEADFDDLPEIPNRVAVGDPYDLIINTVEVPVARKGALSCVYDDWDAIEPAECRGADQKLKDGILMPLEFLSVMPCKR